MRQLDWLSKLQHLLQTMAFCLAIATVQYAFQPERPYAPPVAYSILIGFFTWAFIDLGRHLFASSTETGWPQGMAGVALVAGSIIAGYFLGTALADLACRSFGWYVGGPPVDRGANLRQSILITALAGIAGSFYFYAVNKSAPTWNARWSRRATMPARRASSCCSRSWSRTCCSTRWPTCAC
jgi:hypothetical protein